MPVQAGLGRGLAALELESAPGQEQAPLVLELGLLGLVQAALGPESVLEPGLVQAPLVLEQGPPVLVQAGLVLEQGPLVLVQAGLEPEWAALGLELALGQAGRGREEGEGAALR